MNRTPHRLPAPGGYLLFPTCCSNEFAEKPDAMLVAYDRHLRSRIAALARAVRRHHLERAACAWNCTWLESVYDTFADDGALSEALDNGEPLWLAQKLGDAVDESREQSGVRGHVLVVGQFSWWFEAYCKYAGCVYSTPDVGLRPTVDPFVPWDPDGDAVPRAA